jgi:putative hydrolase of the HAD superfamily
MGDMVAREDIAGRSFQRPVEREMLWGEIVVNIVFDLGGVVVTWEPEAIIAKVFADPMMQALVHTEIFRHADWLALDRGTLPWQDAMRRGAQRTGLSEAGVAALLQQVPPALVAIPGTVDLLYRLKAQGHTLFCLSNMHVASIAHLEQAYTFWEVFTGVVVSCRLHVCKPEPAIYAYLLETYGLEGAHTVFIDDTEVNLTAAAQFGMRTIKFESPAQCERQLQVLGCISPRQAGDGERR